TTSTDELEEAAEELTDDDMSGIAMQPERGYKIFEEWANWLFAEDGEIIDDSGEVALDSPEARKALEKYIDTFEESAPDDSMNWGFDEAQRSITSGESAMMISYNWMLPTVNDPAESGEDLAGEFDIAEVPGEKSVLGAWFWAIPSNSNNKDESWEFISWVTHPDQDLDRVLQGGAPTRMDVMDKAGEEDEGQGEDYYEIVKSSLENSEPIADGPNAEEAVQEVGKELSEAISGNKSVDEAVTDAAKELEKTMEE